MSLFASLGLGLLVCATVVAALIGAFRRGKAAAELEQSAAAAAALEKERATQAADALADEARSAQADLQMRRIGERELAEQAAPPGTPADAERQARELLERARAAEKEDNAS